MKTESISTVALCALLFTACDPETGDSTDTDGMGVETDVEVSTSGGPVEIEPECAQILQADVRVGFEVAPVDAGLAQSYARSVALATCQGQAFTLCITVVNERECVEVTPSGSCELVGAPSWDTDHATTDWAPMGPAIDAVSWAVQTYPAGVSDGDPLDEISIESAPALPWACVDGECDFALDPYGLDALGCE